MKRIFAIGDIHGCLQELQELLEIVDRQATDRDTFVFLGDYIDRGPDSKGVIQLLLDRQRNKRSFHVFLRGNHEDMMIHANTWYQNSYGYRTFESYGLQGIVSDRLMNSIPASHNNFLLRTQQLFSVNKLNLVFAHAGINPVKSLEDQTESETSWGNFVGEGSGGRYPDRVTYFGHIIFPGYQPYINRESKQIGIDTGCVFGGSLTCAVIDQENPMNPDFISVKSNFSCLSPEQKNPCGHEVGVR